MQQLALPSLNPRQGKGQFRMMNLQDIPDMEQCGHESDESLRRSPWSGGCDGEAAGARFSRRLA
eukprot:5213266-Pyramimonas_sp.AAC.1